MRCGRRCGGSEMSKLVVRADAHHVIFGPDLSTDVRQAILAAAQYLKLVVVPNDNGGFYVEVPDHATATEFGRMSGKFWLE